MIKQTIANNAFLRAAKRLFNKPTYARLAALMNEGNHAPGTTGLGRCEAYLLAAGLPTDPAAALNEMAREAR